jgi:hypothetical protein
MSVALPLRSLRFVAFHQALVCGHQAWAKFTVACDRFAVTAWALLNSQQLCHKLVPSRIGCRPETYKSGSIIPTGEKARLVGCHVRLALRSARWYVTPALFMSDRWKMYVHQSLTPTNSEHFAHTAPILPFTARYVHCNIFSCHLLVSALL